MKSLLSPISSNSSTSLQDLLSCEAPVDKYFESIEQILKKKCEERTPVDTQLIAGYLTYLSDFYQVMNKHYTDKTKEIFNKIAAFMYYIELPSDILLFRVGDEGKRFYIILDGSVDVLISKPKKEKLKIAQYYRYLAFLFGYNEIDLLNKVINDNSNIYQIEIDDPSGYGKIYNISISEREKVKPKKLTIGKFFQI